MVIYGLKKPVKDMATYKRIMNVIDRSKVLSTYCKATIDKNNMLRLGYRERFEARRAKRLLETYL
jgi:hypothetical protein